MQSDDREIAEDLLRFFVDEGQRECFAACLYTCYDLVKPDVALEVAWTNGLMDSVMPFLIQTLKCVGAVRGSRPQPGGGGAGGGGGGGGARAHPNADSSASQSAHPTCCAPGWLACRDYTSKVDTLMHERREAQVGWRGPGRRQDACAS